MRENTDETRDYTNPMLGSQGGFPPGGALHPGMPGGRHLAGPPAPYGGPFDARAPAAPYGHGHSHVRGPMGHAPMGHAPMPGGDMGLAGHADWPPQHMGYGAPPDMYAGWHPPPPPAGPMVVMAYGIAPERLTCKLLFNLFCLYGNVSKVC